MMKSNVSYISSYRFTNTSFSIEIADKRLDCREFSHKNDRCHQLPVRIRFTLFFSWLLSCTDCHKLKGMDTGGSSEIGCP